jgi:SAM-dependent methyltransferase
MGGIVPRLNMIPTLLRETFGEHEFPREPEPDLVMENQEQVKAYSLAGRIDGVMSAAYLFQSARICSTIFGKKNVLDLGCGPATQLAQIAQLLPETHFTGVDLSAEMLVDAKQHIAELGINNVDFIENDITRLDKFADQSFDAVISTMALHHLPNYDDLVQCFQSIQRVLKPDGAIYLTDFGRLKSLKSVLFFAYLNRKFQPHSFSLDYERSLRAAFLPSDFINLALENFGDRVQVFNTFGIPILVVVKTKDISIPSAVTDSLRDMRKRLPTKYRRELDDIRLFFWLSGLRNDPF